MQIQVTLFAALREIAGKSILTIESPGKCSCAEVVSEIRQKIPALAEILNSSLVAVNGTYVDKSAVVSAEDEIAILPPVSGG